MRLVLAVPLALLFAGGATLAGSANAAEGTSPDPDTFAAAGLRSDPWHDCRHDAADSRWPCSVSPHGSERDPVHAPAPSQPHRPEFQPNPQVRSDTKIAEELRRRIEQDCGLHQEHIGVFIEDRVVYLSGMVHAPEEAQRLLELVGTLNEVERIESEIAIAHDRDGGRHEHRCLAACRSCSTAAFFFESL